MISQPPPQSADLVNGYVLACVSDHPRMMMLLRVAKRHALALGVPWVALHIVSPHIDNDDEESSMRVLQNMTIAEQMGAQCHQLEAKAVLGGIRDFIGTMHRQGREARAVLVGSTIKETWWQRRLTPLTTRLRKLLNNHIDLVPVPLEALSPPRRPWWLRWWQQELRWRDIGYAMLAVVISTLLIELIHMLLPEALKLQTRNMSIIYMAACAFVASRHGFIPGLTAGVASFLVFNLVYVSPYIYLMVNDMSDALNFALFVGGAALISIFCSSTHERADRLTWQVAQLRGLFRLNRTALRKHSRHRMLEALHLEVKELLHTEVVFFLPTALMPPSPETAYPPVNLRPDERAALAACWDEARVTGYASLVSPNSRYRFKPMMGSSDLVGVIGINCEHVEVDLDALQIFNAVTELVGLILERLELTALMEEGRIREEREKLRAMLVSSISHDLKTPLASVIGGLSVLRSMGQRLAAEQRDILVDTALEEAQRLDTFISNILEMTRLESGQIEFKKDWVNIGDAVSNALRLMRAHPRAGDFSIDPIHSPNIEAQVDSATFDQLLQNLFDNAIKYTPAGTPIIVSWQTGDLGLRVTIRDHGPGIPEDHIDKIFDKYTRLSQQDRKVAGTGLGLAIARTTIRMQGGDIKVHNHPDGGAAFTIILPRWRNAAAEVA